MSDRVVNLLAALAALAVLVLLFMPRNEVHVSFPTTVETGPDGLYAMKTWLDESGIKTSSLRQGFQALKGTGNLLVISWPTEQPIGDDEFRHLRSWLNHGNQLVVLAAIDNLPAWSLPRERDIDKTLTALGVQQARKKGKATGRTKQRNVRSDLKQVSAMVAGRDVTYHPTLDTRLFYGIHAFTMPQPVIGRRLALNDPKASYLPLLERGNHVVLWFMSSARLDNGMFLFTSSSPFSNQLIGKRGHRQLLKNLLDLYLEPGSSVIFDDFHQGLSNVYDVHAFLSDPRFYATLLTLILLWLIYISFYAARFGPPNRHDDRAGTEAFLRRLGNFLARTARRDDINSQLLASFNNAWRRHHRLPQNGDSIVGLLTSTGVASADAVQELRALQEQIQRRKGQSPLVVQRRLTNIRGQL